MVAISLSTVTTFLLLSTGSSRVAAAPALQPSARDTAKCDYYSFKLRAPDGPSWGQARYATTQSAGVLGFSGTSLGQEVALATNRSDRAARFTLARKNGQLYAADGGRAYWFGSLAELLFGSDSTIAGVRAYEQPGGQPVTVVNCSVPAANGEVLVCDPDGGHSGNSSTRYRRWDTCWGQGSPLRLIKGDPTPPYDVPHTPTYGEAECGGLEVVVAELACVKSLPSGASS